MLKHLPRSFAMAAIAITALSASAGHAQVKLGKVSIFKEWAVACDNGLKCEATTFQPENFPGDGLSLSMTREAGREGEITIAIYGGDIKTERYRLLVDRKLVTSGTMVPGAAVAVTGIDALKLARALVSGQKLRMTDGDGKELGSLSLSGSSAAMRYMDAAQGRAGNASAIVARGRKAASGTVVALPVIHARKIIPSEILPDTPAMVSLSEDSPCAAERSGPSEDTVHSLGNNSSGNAQALVLLNCGSGAYNFSYGAYVGTREGGKWKFAPASFDHFDSNMRLETVPLLVNAGWDADSQSLSAFSKGRGVADCGSSEQYVWDGMQFRLILANRMDECRGSMDWLTVWRADVKLLG